MNAYSHDVFISYSSKDKTVADAVCAVMERNNIRCWIAPRDIMPGPDWAQSIIRGINGARVFLLIFSSFSNTSPQIKREVERAAHRGIPIIPFRIDDVLPNETLEYFISTPHWLDALTPPLEAHAQRLADTVGRLLGEGEGEAKQSGPDGSALRPAADGVRSGLNEPQGVGSFLRKMSSSQRVGLVGGSALALVLTGSAVGMLTQNAADSAPLDQRAAATAPNSSPGWIGVHLQSLDEQTAQVAGLGNTRGAYITLVGPDARKAGLRMGDIVLTVNGQPVTDADSALEHTRALGPGADAALGIARGGERLTISVRTMVPPDERAMAAFYRQPVPESVTATGELLRPEDFNTARWMELRHYPATQHWEFGRLGTDALVSYLVPKEGQPVLLNGTSAPIHGYNSRIRLDLSSSNMATEYLRFFTAHVWGDEGAFLLVENADALPSAARGTDNEYHMPVSTRRVGEVFESDTVTLYGGTLAAARYRVHPGGSVEMLDDRELATGLPKSVLYLNGQRRPADLTGLDPSDWPLPPPLPGVWQNPTYEEFSRVRQLILSVRDNAAP